MQSVRLLNRPMSSILTSKDMDIEMKKISSKVILVTLVVLYSQVILAATGHLSGEQVSGTNKICYYNVMGSTHSINVSTVTLCPLTYEFKIM
jgi:hypothetical protein